MNNNKDSAVVDERDERRRATSRKAAKIFHAKHKNDEDYRAKRAEHERNRPPRPQRIRASITVPHHNEMGVLEFGIEHGAVLGKLGNKMMSKTADFGAHVLSTFETTQSSMVEQPPTPPLPIINSPKEPKLLDDDEISTLSDVSLEVSEYATERLEEREIPMKDVRYTVKHGKRTENDPDKYPDSYKVESPHTTVVLAKKQHWTDRTTVIAAWRPDDSKCEESLSSPPRKRQKLSSCEQEDRGEHGLAVEERDATDQLQLELTRKQAIENDLREQLDMERARANRGWALVNYYREKMP